MDRRALLHVVATAHLDTQWLWTVRNTIKKHLPATLRGNFALFERFPHYVFSFEGAFRYMLVKEYYPEDYARLREHVAAGRWRVCGSFVDAVDVNIPSPESLIRQILYGNGFFQREFGRQSCDIFLPDCFGFGYALPSLAAHCGIRGFSTQKLTWGSAVGIPFDLGLWVGVDGAAVVSALNAGDYTGRIRSDLSSDAKRLESIERTGRQSGANVGYMYFGVGDQGGAPDEESVEWLEKSLAGPGPIRVHSAPADAIYPELTADQMARLPQHRGELLLTKHGVGCYTSQAVMKRWNHRNELLADAAERAAVAADWLGGAAYPHDKLTQNWTRFLWHQFHDDLTGTSIPQAYTFSWNDELIALNGFAAVTADAVGAVARALDTQVQGVPLIVYNPLAVEREDVVEAIIAFPGPAPKAVRVFDPAGREVLAQVGDVNGNSTTVVFLAQVPPVGLAVYDVRPAAAPPASNGELTATVTGLENQRLRVVINNDGDVAGIFDKLNQRELLAEPHRLQMLDDRPDNWPEWEIEYRDIQAAPRACVASPATVRVIERGPARATVEIAREAAGSLFIQRIRLAAGAAANRVDFDTRIDWRTPSTLLKAAFPLTVANPSATYDLGLGVIERGNNHDRLYEVPAQQWADLTAADGQYGVTVMSDCKYGWDKPDDRTLRLTLIHSPNCIKKDMGWHRLTYAISGHAGDWRTGDAVGQAARLNQPLLAFQTARHPGGAGRLFSLLAVSTPQVKISAIKKAESGDRIVIRLFEAWGRTADRVVLSPAGPVVSADEMTGDEEYLRPLEIQNGSLTLSLQPYQPRTIALQLAPPPAALKLTPPTCRPIQLPYDIDVISFDDHRADGDFDGQGHSLPAELLLSTVVSEGIAFKIGPTADGQKNALACRGQVIPLPTGDFNRLYLLAAAVGDDTRGTFVVDGRPTELTIHSFSGFVGQWNSLVVGGEVVSARQMSPGYTRSGELAWVGTHRHHPDDNEPYEFCYLFKYRLDLPPGAKTLTLPNNDRIRLLAITAANNANDETSPARDLYDRLVPVRITPPGGTFTEPVMVSMEPDVAGAEILFTTNGAVPTALSPVYRQPVQVCRNTVITARVRTPHGLEDYLVRTAYQFAEGPPSRPVDQTGVQS